MGADQSKLREEELQRQKLELDRKNLKLREEQLELKLQLETLKRKEKEEEHRRELEEARRQRKSEEEKHQTQLQIERQWNIKKLLEEKKKNEELKKQTEEIERKLQETQLQQKHSSVFQKDEKCNETYVHQVLETVKRQTQEIQKNVQEKPPHQEQDFSQQVLFKQNNLQQPVGNIYVSKPKETANMEQHTKILNQKKEKPLLSQHKDETHFSQQVVFKQNNPQQPVGNIYVSNPKANMEQHTQILNQKKEKPLLSQQKDETHLQMKEDRNKNFPLKESNKQKFPLEGKIHKRQPTVDGSHQKHYTGTRRKYYRSKIWTEKTQTKLQKKDKLEDLSREHEFYVAPITTRYMWHAVLRESLASKWMPMPKDKSYIKVEIPKNSDEFANIERVFTASQAAFKIVQVDRIQNPYLLGCYMLKSLEMKNMFGSVTEKMLFRGTKRRNVHNICQDNFNWRYQEGENSRNKFGKGVYFNTSVYNATFYSDKDSIIKLMFFVRVLISKETQHDPDMIVPPQILGSGPNINNQNNVVRFDTTRANGGKIFVKYSDNDFYPQYLIHYTEESK
ncbi:hypothetical protein C0J52_26803 [Blattella germanica]|nr:hypothetical protein C0J52_26803 [Blattella germanica]